MGWWTNAGDLVGDDSANVIELMLETLVQTTSAQGNSKPSLQDLLQCIQSVINQHNFELLETQESIVIAKIVAQLIDFSEIESVENSLIVSQEWIAIIYENLIELKETFEGIREQRKPRLRELLLALCFVLGYKPEKYLSIEPGLGVKNITVYLEQGNTISTERPQFVMPEKTEAKSELKEEIPSELELDLGSSWRDIGYTDLINDKRYDDVVSYDLIRLLENNFKEVAESYKKINGNLPTLQIFLDYIASTLLYHQKKLISNDELNSFQKLVMVIEDQSDLISDGGGIPADDPFVKAYTEAFTSLSKSYQLKWQRKPRIREVLATFDAAIDIILDNLVCDIDSDIYIEETLVK